MELSELARRVTRILRMVLITADHWAQYRVIAGRTSIGLPAGLILISIYFSS